MTNSPSESQVRLVLTVALSCAVLFGWHFFYQMPKLKAQEEARKAQVQQQLEMPSVAVSSGESLAPSASDRLAPVASLAKEQESKPVAEVLAQSPRIRINNGKLHGSISLVGARIDDLTLAEYRENTEPGAKEVTLLAPQNTNAMYVAEFGWLAREGVKVPDATTRWQSDRDMLTEREPVTLYWDNGQGQRFYLSIALDPYYLFDITQRVENYSDRSITLHPYGMLHRRYVQGEHAPFAILHEGPIGVFNGILHEARYEKMKDEPTQKFENVRGWLGISDKYWLTALVPDADQQITGNFTHITRNAEDRYQVDFLGESRALSAGDSLVLRHHFFAGAKKVELLDEYAEKFSIPLFDRAVDFGWLYFITKPIFHLLTFFHHLVGNFGVAILLLTVTIKLILFPLANKSYSSMSQMKRVQPEVVKLRERYTDDKVKLNQEMMALYKREGINPMSGCLPMIVQIPVFFALYKVLFVTIEMRHAPFFGWVHDLSAPDPTNLFTAFGLIPWSPPGFLHVGIWALIMGATMVWQQKMQPAPADPVQAQVMKLLPFIFTFLFAGFPAGLMVYWAWNNTLSVTQQWFITKQLERKSRKSPRAAKPSTFAKARAKVKAKKAKAKSK